MSSKQGGKAKPLKKPKSDKKDYDEEVGKVVDGRDTSECSQFNDPLKKSCLERGDQGSKMKLRKRRKHVYSEVQGPSDKPAVKFLRSMKKNIVVTVLLRRSMRLISKVTCDHVTLQYLKLTGRSDETVAMIEAYLRANKLFVDYNEPQQDRVYSSYLELNLDEVKPCILGPKRPYDRVPLKEMKADWHSCLDNKVGFKVLMNFARCQEKELLLEGIMRLKDLPSYKLPSW